jgi:hypothetical protein
MGISGNCRNDVHVSRVRRAEVRQTVDGGRVARFAIAFKEEIRFLPSPEGKSVGGRCDRAAGRSGACKVRHCHTQ